jgi:hypothetical protein
LSESSSDCNHDWEPRKGRLVCKKCGYVARERNFKRWWNLYGKYNWRERPYCLNCREPTMFFGGLCKRCRTKPQIQVPPPPTAAEQAAAWAKVDKMAEERLKDEAELAKKNS